MATITSAASGLWSAGATWVGGSAPADNDTVIIAAGHSVIFDVDMSGWANGIAGLTITSHATTPGMLVAKHDAAGTYHLKMKAATNIVGTNAAVFGRILANSDGVWGNTGALPFDRKFIIEFAGTNAGQITATYLDINLRCADPSVKSVALTSHTVGNATVGVDTDVSADAHWASGALLSLVNEAAGNVDNQLVTLVSKTADSITLSAAVDSAQAPGVLYLMSRNIEIRSASTGSTARCIDGGKNAYLGCALIKTAATTAAKYGYGVYIGSGHTISGSVSGCTSGVIYGSGHTISGSVSGCSYGVIYGSVRLAGGTLSNNSRDLYSCITSGAASLDSTVQNGAYKYATLPMVECRFAAMVMPLGGVQGALGCWTQGGYAKSAAYSAGTHGTPPVASSLIHEQTFEDNNRLCYVEFPYYAEKAHQVTVIFHGKLTGTASFDVLPSIGIYDADKPWQDATAALAVATMEASTDWQTLEVTYTTTDDRPLDIRVQGKGGNAGGTGTERLYWFIEGVEAVPTTLAAQVDALNNRLTATRAGYLDNLATIPAKAGDPMTLTAAYDAAKEAASQASVDAIPTTPLLAADYTAPDNASAQAAAASAASADGKLTAERLAKLDGAAQEVWEYATRTLTDKVGFTLTEAYDHAKDDVLTPLQALDGKVDALNDFDPATQSVNVGAVGGTEVTGPDDLKADVSGVALAGEAASALASYDPPTKAELDAAVLPLAKDATVMKAASYVAPDNAGIAAIEAKTSNLPSDPADASDIAAAFAGLNDVSQAQVQAAAAAALSAYDPPTRAEATSDKSAIIAAIPTDYATAASLSSVASSVGALPDIIRENGRGAGAAWVTLHIKDDRGNNVPSAEVWVTSDEDGETLVASGVTSDDGTARFKLDPGSVYYAWRTRAGVNFSNPVRFTAVAD